MPPYTSLEVMMLLTLCLVFLIRHSVSLAIHSDDGPCRDWRSVSGKGRGEATG